MPKPVKRVGIREMLEGVTISKVDMSPSGCEYRLWRASQRPRENSEHILVCEIHTGHIFDSLGRYVLNDVISAMPQPDA